MLSGLKNFANQIFHSGKVVKYKGIIIISTFLIIIVSIVTIGCMRKKITINVDGKESVVVTYRNTVKEALQSSNIELSEEDRVQPSLNSKLLKNQVIAIKRSMPITIESGDKKIDIIAIEGTVEEMLQDKKEELKENSIEFNNNIDEISPKLNSELEENQTVKIVKVATENVVETETIDYDTVIEEDSNLDVNYKSTKQQGINGKSEITYEVTYKDGKEFQRTKKSSKMVVSPKNTIIVKGVNALAASRGTNNSKKTLSCSATAYSGGWGTSSGRKPVRVEGGLSTIAVDPAFIPMGSKVYVEGYGYAVAADTGTGIKGNKIDLYFNSYKESCDWGLKMVNVTIIAGPGEW